VREIPFAWIHWHSGRFEGGSKRDRSDVVINHPLFLIIKPFRTASLTEQR
jgi:hypothetical protein